MVLPAPAGAAPASGWGGAALLEFRDEYALDGDLAANEAGQAVAVWEQSDGALFDLWSARFEPGMGWGLPTKVKDGNLSGGLQPHVAIDPGGNATVIWSVPDNSRFDVWAGRSEPASGWSAMVKIENDDAGGAWTADIAADETGSAMALWIQVDGAVSSLLSSRYVPGVGWGTPAPVESEALSLSDGRLAVSADGHAAAVWLQWDGARYNTWGNLYTPGVGWAAAGAIDTDDTNEASKADVVIDSTGAATAVWLQSTGSRVSVWAGRYAPATGWGAPELVEQESVGESQAPHPVVDAAGVVTVGYVQVTNAYYRAAANRYVPGAGWGTPVIFEIAGSGDVFEETSIACSAAGHVLLGFGFYKSGLTSIGAAAYAEGSGWSAPTLLETSSRFLGSPRVAVSGGGDGWMLVDRHDGQSYDITVRGYTAPDITPPPLSVTSPLDGAVTNGSTIRVEGLTEPGATVSVNGYMAAVGKSGAFAMDLPLEIGQNQILVVARDDSPLDRAVTVVAHRVTSGPLPENDTGLVYAQEEIANLSALLNDTRVDLAAAQAALSSTQAALSSAQAGLIAADARINATAAGVGTAPASSDSLPLILALVGVLLGGAALALGFLRKGGGRGGGGDGRLVMKPDGDLKRYEPGVETGQPLPGVPSYEIKK